MKNVFFAILLICFISFLSSCNQPCKSGSEYYPLADQLKKYSFKPGSYWIYQDSLSGTIDSQSVISYSTQNNISIASTYTGNGGTCDIHSDVFSMSISSFWNGISHGSMGIGNNTEFGNVSTLFVLYSFASSQNDLYAYPAFSGNQTVTLANFTVSGQTFPIVYKEISNFYSQMYHVDNIGVVKWVFNDSINGQHTWNLLRYHVINP